jgi:uncharacterized Zn finger protein
METTMLRSKEVCCPCCGDKLVVAGHIQKLNGPDVILRCTTCGSQYQSYDLTDQTLRLDHTVREAIRQQAILRQEGAARPS